MEIDTAARQGREKLRTQLLSEVNHETQVGIRGAHLLEHAGIVDVGRLQHPEAERLSQLRHRCASKPTSPPGAPRRKLTRIADLLAVLDGDDDGAPVTGV